VNALPCCADEHVIFCFAATKPVAKAAKKPTKKPTKKPVAKATVKAVVKAAGTPYVINWEVRTYAPLRLKAGTPIKFVYDTNHNVYAGRRGVSFCSP
jgi:hypothetical protein